MSSEEQRERQSIETQRVEIERYCAAHQIIAPVVYSDDGVSGTIPFESRPGGAALLQDARAGKIAKLLIYKLDRLGRSTLVTLSAIKALEEIGVAITCTSEPYDSSTPAGRLMTTMLAGMATLERENIRERSTAGLNRKARAGEWCNGAAPYGYRLEGRYLVLATEPVPGVGMSEVEVITLLYTQLATTGTSSLSVAAHLNRLGVPPPGARRTGRPATHQWSDGGVRKLARSPLYRGEYAYGRRPKGSGPPRELIVAAVPAIVTGALAAAAQAGLAGNQRRSMRNCQHEYLLRTLVRCAGCGRSYCGLTARGRIWYACGGRSIGCTSKQVRGAELEDAVWGDVENFLRHPGAVINELAAQLTAGDASAATSARRLKTAQTRLAGMEAGRDRVITAFRRGAIGPADLDTQLAAIEAEQSLLATEIAHLKDTGARTREREARLQGAAGLLAELNTRLDQPLTFQTKRALVLALVDNIQIATVGHGAARDTEVTVRYCFNLPGVPILGPTARGRHGNNALPRQAILERAHRLAGGYAVGGAS